MELRALAERIVFATTLEEKLACPEVITDEHPGAATDSPASPGRPTRLRFKAGGPGSSEFPGARQLERETERGRLLHFFANHELLATELMALVLLRFPDAPATFRRGVLKTLRDEQAHTRLYMERMRQCGIEFGELPVSGYFWRAVAPLQHPIDYVARLSLTFEQANLDFCRHFAGCFESVGDATTASLLEGIYHDEIAHVAYGLKWFRRWKNPGLTDWEAFCRQLQFPLSPSRAKGFVVNVEGRRAAGFDEDFIDHLKVHSQSKGRTPVVYLFNPLSEGSVREGKRFNARRHSRQLAEDLCNLPQFLCRQGDVVLVSRRPSTEFLGGVKSAGFALPEFVEYSGCVLPSGGSLAGRKLADLRPWAWGPDSVELLGPLLAQVSGKPRTAEECFNPGIASLYSKAWSAQFLSRVLPGLPEQAWLCPPEAAGIVASSVGEVLEAVRRIREHGHHRVVVKEAVGIAGQGHLRLWEPEILETQRRWIGSTLEAGGVVVVEPWLERITDFSVQLECTAGSLRWVGYTGLVNDPRGQFQGNWAEPQHARRPPVCVAAALDARGDAASRIHGVFRALVAALEPALQEAGFQGPLGIDAFVYRDAGGRARLKPVVEINPRYTMGRVTLELMGNVAPGSYGRFRILSRPMIRATGFADFPAYVRDLAERCPLELRGAPVPRIRSGALPLNDPGTAVDYLATFEVETTAGRFEPG